MKHTLLGGILVLSLSALPARALNIVIDYSLDTNNFFATQDRRDALEAAATRYESLITTTLGGVSVTDFSGTWRVGFSHPGTGDHYELSVAANASADSLILAGADAADQYGFAGLAEDTWVLFAGGRAMTSAGLGGTGSGTNFTTTLSSPDGPTHRGAFAVSETDPVNDLPVWGGSIAFDTGRDWHFGIDSAAPSLEIDFYTVALHEIGHVLGLATAWNQWDDDGSGHYIGGLAVETYNTENGTSLTELNEVSSVDPHWEDGAYDSEIFDPETANLAGTVGEGMPQDLLMEPVANFTSTVRRFELTNVDAAALQDVGWTVVPEPGALSLGLLGLAWLAATRRRR